MKIAYYPGTFLPVIGGAEICIHQTAKKQSELGHEVYIIVSSKEAMKLKELFGEDEIPYKIICLRPMKIIGLMHKLKQYGINIEWWLKLEISRIQNKYKFDVWHYHLVSNQALFTIPILKSLKIPSIVTCHGADIQKVSSVPYGYRLDPNFDEKFVKVVPQANGFTAISESIRKDYINAGVEPKKITIIPNGAELRKITQFKMEKSEIRDKLQWPQDKKIIITVGRNHPKKGYRFIPDIVEHLIQKDKNILWFVIGKKTEQLAKEVQERGLDEYVKFTGEIGIRSGKKTLDLPTDNLIEAYKAADVFCLPTIVEGLPLVLLEAMAANLGIITTDSPGARDLITHTQNGLLSPIGDSEHIANNIFKYLHNKELQKRFSLKIEESVETFDWNKISQHYLDFYKAVISENRPSLV